MLLFLIKCLFFWFLVIIFLEDCMGKIEIGGQCKCKGCDCKNEENKKLEDKIEKKEQKIEDFVNAIYQNIQTALKSIDEILKINKDASFEVELQRERGGYEKIKNNLLEECLKIGVKPEDNNFFEKAKLFTSIKMTTIADKSTRHLAEMMLIGTVMGTLTCYKDQNDYRNSNNRLYKILSELVEFEENNFNKLKIFLKEN